MPRQAVTHESGNSANSKLVKLIFAVRVSKILGIRMHHLKNYSESKKKLGGIFFSSPKSVYKQA